MTVKPGWARKRDRLRRREADAAPAAAVSPPWALSAAEWRLLVITFVGGLGSIVAAACAIGVAVALVRHNRDLHGWLLGLYTAGALLLFAYGLWAYRVNPPRGRAAKRAMWGSIAVASAILVLVLLFWVGIAAGIK